MFLPISSVRALLQHWSTGLQEEVAANDGFASAKRKRATEMAACARFANDREDSIPQVAASDGFATAHDIGRQVCKSGWQSTPGLQGKTASGFCKTATGCHLGGNFRRPFAKAAQAAICKEISRGSGAPRCRRLTSSPARLADGGLRRSRWRRRSRGSGYVRSRTWGYAHRSRGNVR